MARLISIEFKKVRNVREGTRPTFLTEGAVLLGKNGSGKTTLLDYIVGLCSINPAAFESEDGFHVRSRIRSSASGRSDYYRISTIWPATNRSPSPTSSSTGCTTNGSTTV
jgi:ABC-type uncharacterized transport system ATPase subunit